MIYSNFFRMKYRTVTGACSVHAPSYFQISGGCLTGSGSNTHIGRRTDGKYSILRIGYLNESCRIGVSGRDSKQSILTQILRKGFADPEAGRVDFFNGSI